MNAEEYAQDEARISTGTRGARMELIRRMRRIGSEDEQPSNHQGR